MSRAARILSLPRIDRDASADPRLVALAKCLDVPVREVLAELAAMPLDERREALRATDVLDGDSQP